MILSFFTAALIIGPSIALTSRFAETSQEKHSVQLEAPAVERDRSRVRKSLDSLQAMRTPPRLRALRPALCSN